MWAQFVQDPQAQTSVISFTGIVNQKLPRLCPATAEKIATLKHARLHDPAIQRGVSSDSALRQVCAGWRIARFVWKSRFMHDSSPIQRFNHGPGTKARQPPISIGSSWNRIQSCDTYRDSYDTNYHALETKLMVYSFYALYNLQKTRSWKTKWWTCVWCLFHSN